MTGLENYIIHTFWLISALIGLSVRVILLLKYRADQEAIKYVTGIRKPFLVIIIKRNIESMSIHILVKSMFVAIAASAILRDIVQGPTNTTPASDVFLIVMPLILAFDGFRELRTQNILLRRSDLHTNVKVT